MKIDKKYIVIAVCTLIGGVLTATLAFIGPDIITNGTINPNNVVTGNLKLKITDTSVNINNMAPIRSSNYETEAFKKEFTISNAESTLNGCMKLYLNFNSISDTLKSEYLVYKVVSSTGKVSEGSFKDIADNKLLIYDSDFIESSKSITYTLYIWLRYVEDPTINLTSLLGTSVNAYVSVNGTDTKESTSCTFDSSNKISYVVTFMNTDNKTVLESRKVSSGSTLGNTPNNKIYVNKKDGTGTEYDSSYIVNEDIMLYYLKLNFSTDSWDTIVTNVQNGRGEHYVVGDVKEVDLGTYGTHTLRLANTSTPGECSRAGFSQTACGFVLEFQDIITTSKMNNAYSNTGGWNNAEMNTFINNNIYNALPNELKEIIIDTIVVSSYGKNDTANFTTTNKLYLLAPKEIYTDYAETTDTAKDLTRILDYYKEKRVTMNSYANAIKYNNSTATWWWLRNVPSSNSGNFFGVNVTGILNNNYAHFVGGVSQAFRIG